MNDNIKLLFKDFREVVLNENISSVDKISILTRLVNLFNNVNEIIKNNEKIRMLQYDNLFLMRIEIEWLSDDKVFIEKADKFDKKLFSLLKNNYNL